MSEVFEIMTSWEHMAHIEFTHKKMALLLFLPQKTHQECCFPSIYSPYPLVKTATCIIFFPTGLTKLMPVASHLKLLKRFIYEDVI